MPFLHSQHHGKGHLGGGSVGEFCSHQFQFPHSARLSYSLDILIQTRFSLLLTVP